MSKDYLAEIKAQTQALGWARDAETAAKKALSQYDEEYRTLVHQLKVKHNHAAQMEKLNKAAKNIATLEYQNHRSGVQMVVDAVVQMFRANPGFIQGTRAKLEQRWGIETTLNANVNEVNEEACFTELAKLVCDNDWWDKYRFAQQSNGMTWVCKPKQFDWEPLVGIGVSQVALVRLGAVAAYAKLIGLNENICVDIETAAHEALDNADRFAYPRGTGPISISLYMPARNDLAITVKNKGVGIPDAQKARMPLYTSDPEEKQSGMGFTIMEAFADKVAAKSVPGKGTTVTMWFRSKKKKI